MQLFFRGFMNKFGVLMAVCDITSDQPILSRPKMAPQLKLPGTQAKCTEGPFWTQLEYTEGPFWTKLECTEGPFWLSKAV